MRQILFRALARLRGRHYGLQGGFSTYYERMGYKWNKEVQWDKQGRTKRKILTRLGSIHDGEVEA